MWPGTNGSRLVGIELGIEEEQLDLISKEENPIVCFSKVLSQWKKKADTDFPGFTWRTIAMLSGLQL